MVWLVFYLKTCYIYDYKWITAQLVINYVKRGLLGNVKLCEHGVLQIKNTFWLMLKNIGVITKTMWQLEEKFGGMKTENSSRGIVTAITYKT